ncbi:exodeoxyribonuclease VII large subunit [Prevotella sp. P3-120]|uniref:Exodeoxyribonuclease 7 large subunit n=1 Tax=Xylanibacter brevis TaxID=83231 RepID=A0ABS9CBL1_9BACT|nr:MULTISPECIES: exodeoxyribonuclease VII large subunit [Prevotellaceae]MBS7319269.1 exodeoxyribonuclease VII large subunit [Prevotella sp.]MCF2562515.1 exodeoxyribonuclease VII large subunit [Xylanibacter brevis]OYP46682.1 exodeoxyribonuclease VII large subunit [Prevotella sp. P4-119]OYP49573.1 exodeoxyribonuclease VII large subunit [Prevotella sp. P3-92]OYP52656.1 exodeoxyribonuclease VII large subunit [Prevotella sp. P3-120]
MEQSHHFSLYALNALVHEAVSNALPDEYWVEAELAECRERNGHCYMELVEKDERSNSPIAKASAKCWRQTWTLLHATFLRATGQPLRAGMKVLLRVYPQFHEAYGFSWIVSDIDPTYTIGDLARRRQEIIKTLKAQGVFDLQRELRLSPFAQRIAVISAESAAGYGDFCRQLLDNEYNLQFHTELFPAIMQGERVEQSVIQALNLINNRIDDFDAVVIIRGGGATSDMSGFDTLPLAENVANFPLPIITGIGHDRDECVLDMVSHTRVKTPTAAATLLITHLCNTLQQVADAENVIAHYALDRLQRHRLQLEHITTLLPHLAQRLMTEAHHSLERIQLKLEGYDPQLLLQRGYSITLHNGQIVKSPQDVKSGDEIETRLKQGTIKSIIQ